MGTGSGSGSRIPNRPDDIRLGDVVMSLRVRGISPSSVPDPIGLSPTIPHRSDFWATVRFHHLIGNTGSRSPTRSCFHAPSPTQAQPVISCSTTTTLIKDSLTCVGYGCGGPVSRPDGPSDHPGIHEGLIARFTHINRDPGALAMMSDSIQLRDPSPVSFSFSGRLAIPVPILTRKTKSGQICHSCCHREPWHSFYQ